MNNVSKRSNGDESHGGYKKAKKTGRKELRTITRANARHSNEPKDDFENEPDMSSEEVESAGKKPKSDEEEEEDIETKKQKVYNALLTLLESEHPHKKSKKNREGGKEKQGNLQEGAETYSDEDEEEAIENALVETNDDEDDVGSDINDDEDDEDKADSFESHFNNVSELQATKLASAFRDKKIKYKSVKVPVNEDEFFIYSRPAVEGEDGSSVVAPSCKKSLRSYFIKQKLKIQNDLLDDKKEALTPLQKNLVDPMFQYQDLLYEYQSYEQEEEYRDLYALHVLNHVYKTRDRILRNSQKLQDNSDQELLDQGFTRPKVLIVVPTRDVAYQIVTKIIEKSGLDQVDKRGKFQDQFFDASLPPSSKPKSFKHIFKGNTNDFFVLGAKFTRKTLKLYSNFYQSDVIFCSPLGIQLILENTDKKKRQDDFLSSIELMIIDQLHSIEYQNLSHITTIFQHINKIPQQQHDADFSRIRMWYINEQATLFRQTMIFTKYASPFANSLINGKCRNHAGRWKNHNIVLPEKSSINQLGLKVRQIFQRFDLVGGSAMDEPDYRFKFFTSVIIASIVKSTGYEDGILLYIPDYTDYVRVRNYLREKTTLLFGDINEYSEQKQLTSNRALFQQGKAKVLLYTERLHHFRRYEIKGVKSVIFYKPPTNPEFYREVVRYIGKSAFLGSADLNISTVRCVYCKLDGLSLERVVGTKRAAVLTHGQNEIYEFK